MNRALGHFMPGESCIFQSTIRLLKAEATETAEQCPSKKIKSSVMVALHVWAHCAVSLELYSKDHLAASIVLLTGNMKFTFPLTESKLKHVGRSGVVSRQKE